MTGPRPDHILPVSFLLTIMKLTFDRLLRNPSSLLDLAQHSMLGY